MPKSKVNSSDKPYASSASAADRRTPVKLNATGTPRWYIILMLALMVLGIAWLVINYIAGPHIPLMVQLGPWNYLVGFGLLITGLLMTMGWK